MQQTPDLSHTSDNLSGTSSPAGAESAAVLAEAALSDPGTDLSFASGPGTDSATIERVIDVPLTVTLRFGQRHMTVRELLELNTGSLVELDQQVEEPVYLMLGERVIARGEVVIVDGNYGMRVLEVVEHPATQRLTAMGAV